MSSETYVQNVLLCDDIRTENNGKEIAIGIYAGAIAVPQIPAFFPNLIIRFELFFGGTVQTEINFKLTDPAGNILLKQKLPVKFFDWEMPGSVSAALQGLIFPIAGKYTISTSISEETWEDQRFFIVKKFDRSQVASLFENQVKMTRDALKA